MVDSLSVLGRAMDFQSAMETFAEAWVAANVTQVSLLSDQKILDYLVAYERHLSAQAHKKKNMKLRGKLSNILPRT